MSDFQLPAVFEDELFVVTPCIDCDIPGYLILQPREKMHHLFELTPATQSALTHLLGRLEYAILQVTQAEHIYLLRFSEGLSTVHFHLFPRTAELALRWSAATEEATAGINGPRLFAWARIQYHADSPQSLSTETIHAAMQVQRTLHAGS